VEIVELVYPIRYRYYINERWKVYKLYLEDVIQIFDDEYILVYHNLMQANGGVRVELLNNKIYIKVFFFRKFNKIYKL
jgi:hypothetical protein